MAMPSRRLGALDLQVPWLGFGGAPVGRLATTADAAPVIARAYARGLCFFDTAPLYGAGRSETYLGHALRGKARPSFVLATKVGRRVNACGADVRLDFSYDGVLRSAEESLDRLRLETVDILHIHEADIPADVAGKAAYAALDALRRQGRIKGVGLGLNRWQLGRELMRHGRFDCLLLAGQYTLVLCPAYWKDSRGLQTLERKTAAHFVLEAIPMRFNGHFHVHYYPDLGRRLRALDPDLLHMDEEPYNLATWLGVRHAHRLGIGTLFATWQNLRRVYPPPFRWWERDVYGKVDHALAGTPAAKEVLRRKGYQGKVTINPQVGVDTETFAPAPAASPRARFMIGYAGGLVPEKGVDMLLRACAQLSDPWRLQLAGAGADETRLRQLAQRLGIAPHVQFLGRRPSGQMAEGWEKKDFLARIRTLASRRA